MKPLKGQVIDGWKYTGGDPSEQKNWAYVERPVSLATSMRQELESRGGIEKFNAGIGASVDKAAYGLKKAVTGLTPEEQQTLDLGKQTLRTGPGIAGGITGDVLMTAAPGNAVGNLAAQVPGPVARIGANVLGQGALGAGYGWLTSPDNRNLGATLGGAGGAAGGLIGGVLSGPFRPRVGSEAEQLAQQGVPLTAGQSMGGTLKKIEDSLRTMSSNVAKRQSEALERWGQNVVDDALPSVQRSVSGSPIPSTVTGPGRNAIAEGAKVFDQAYDDIYSQVGKVTADQPLVSALTRTFRNYAPRLTRTDAAELMEQMRRIPGEFAQNGTLDGRAIRDVAKSYDALATQAANNGNGRLQEAYAATANALKDVVSRQRPQVANRLADVNDLYADFLRIQKAAGMQGAEEGIFSPNQLKSAIRAMDRSADKRAFARGNARADLLDEAERGVRVLGPTIPPIGPGTAEKLAIPLAAQNFWTTAPAVAAQGMYRPGVQAVLTGRAPWQAGITPEVQSSLATMISRGMKAKENERKR